jgi:hypothetical protein
MPYENVIIGTGEPIESGNLVEFRLLYKGELLCSSRANTRAKHKHEIRRIFHPQLRRLWLLKSGLRGLVEHTGSMARNEHNLQQSNYERGLEAIGRNWESAGFNFIPLVTDKFALRCSLDILLLRPEEKKYIFEQGDIDGQLKTLFDALRRPCDIGEAGGETPTEDEEPFFCLLQDDRLISEVHITTDQLLLLPGEREAKANDTFVVIHVKLNHLTGSPFDRWFEG